MSKALHGDIGLRIEASAVLLLDGGKTDRLKLGRKRTLADGTGYVENDPGCVKTRMLIQLFRGFAGAWHEAVHQRPGSGSGDAFSGLP